MKSFFVIIAISLFQVSSQLKHFQPRDYLASKTPYSLPMKPFSRPKELEHCRVIHINHLGRHGSRHPVKVHEIDNLLLALVEAKQVSALKDPFGSKLFDLVNNTKRKENKATLGQLTEQGGKEHRGIAERMYENFPELFRENSSRPIILASTHVQRTKDSLKAFLERLTEIDETFRWRSTIISSTEKRCDARLRFFEGCNAYEDYLSKAEFKSVVKEAIWQDEANKAVEKVLSRIFSKDFVDKLNNKQRIALVHNIYGLCQLDFDIDHSDKADSFCSFFLERKEMAYFNWEDDAISYFAKGYAGSNGHIAHRVACPLVNDFIAAAEKAIADPAKAPLAHLRFAHAETIVPFLVQMGLHQNDSRETILSQPDRREFRTSRISPMAANVQWILYQCPNDQYHVQLLQNEEAVSFPVPSCDHLKSCNWDMVKEFLADRHCDEKTWALDVCSGVHCQLEVRDHL